MRIYNVGDLVVSLKGKFPDGLDASIELPCTHKGCRTGKIGIGQTFNMSGTKSPVPLLVHAEGTDRPVCYMCYRSHYGGEVEDYASYLVREHEFGRGNVPIIAAPPKVEKLESPRLPPVRNQRPPTVPQGRAGRPIDVGGRPGSQTGGRNAPPPRPQASPPRPASGLGNRIVGPPPTQRSTPVVRPEISGGQTGRTGRPSVSPSGQLPRIAASPEVRPPSQRGDHRPVVRSGRPLGDQRPPSGNSRQESRAKASSDGFGTAFAALQDVKPKYQSGEEAAWAKRRAEQMRLRKEGWKSRCVVYRAEGNNLVTMAFCSACEIDTHKVPVEFVGHWFQSATIPDSMKQPVQTVDGVVVSKPASKRAVTTGFFEDLLVDMLEWVAGQADEGSDEKTERLNATIRSLGEEKADILCRLAHLWNVAIETSALADWLEPERVGRLQRDLAVFYAHRNRSNKMGCGASVEPLPAEESVTSKSAHSSPDA